MKWTLLYKARNLFRNWRLLLPSSFLVETNDWSDQPTFLSDILHKMNSQLVFQKIDYRRDKKTKLVMNSTPKIGVEFKTNGVSILKRDFFIAIIKPFFLIFLLKAPFQFLFTSEWCFLNYFNTFSQSDVHWECHTDTLILNLSTVYVI